MRHLTEWATNYASDYRRSPTRPTGKHSSLWSGVFMTSSNDHSESVGTSK